jgi:glutamate dehydrogenase (NAD(P)+)
MQLCWEKEDVMRPDYRILDRAFDGMPACASVCKAVYRSLGMVIGIDLAHAGTTTCGLLA